MKRFQKFRNTIYFDKYKIMILDNGRFAITDLEFNIIDDLKGQGYKTRRRAANVIQYDKKFKTMNIKEKQTKYDSFKELRNDPEFQKKYELGLKRITLVCCVIATILSPLLFIIQYRLLFFILYFTLLIIGVRFSNKIVEMIWK